MIFGHFLHLGLEVQKDAELVSDTGSADIITSSLLIVKIKPRSRRNRQLFQISKHLFIIQN